MRTLVELPNNYMVWVTAFQDGKCTHDKKYGPYADLTFANKEIDALFGSDGCYANREKVSEEHPVMTILSTKTFHYKATVDLMKFDYKVNTYLLCRDSIIKTSDEVENKAIPADEVEKLVVYFSSDVFIPNMILRLMIKDMLEHDWDFSYMSNTLYKIDRLWECA